MGTYNLTYLEAFIHVFKETTTIQLIKETITTNDILIVIGCPASIQKLTKLAGG
ncbi:hypothetical protein Ga0466249_005161 [Sporomusaceae bacterium BoRhaA]|nr:hypothetical protein [Pelorhabdus rhamnosifermentans]